jgi:hypothetical protein
MGNVVRFRPSALGPALDVDPGADKDYSIIWHDWLNGDSVTASTWAVSPAGPVTYSPSINSGPVTIDGVAYAAGTVTTVWIKTLTAGARYTVTNSITTAGGRKDERSFVLNCRNL